MSRVDAPAEAFPLAWPEGWERTPAHERTYSQFGKNQGTYGTRKDADSWALRHLYDQVRLLGGTGLVISTNVQMRKDGTGPLAKQRLPDDPGVAVYWLQGDEWRVVACDRWARVWENIRAVGLTLEAMRGLDRWGASGILDRVFQGFAALPAPGEVQARGWWHVLEIDYRSVTLEEARAAYRRLAKERHPDRGGSAELMSELNAAWAAAQEALS